MVIIRVGMHQRPLVAFLVVVVVVEIDNHGTNHPSLDAGSILSELPSTNSQKVGDLKSYHFALPEYGKSSIQGETHDTTIVAVLQDVCNFLGH